MVNALITESGMIPMIKKERRRAVMMMFWWCSVDKVMKRIGKRGGQWSQPY